MALQSLHSNREREETCRRGVVHQLMMVKNGLMNRGNGLALQSLHSNEGREDMQKRLRIHAKENKKTNAKDSKCAQESRSRSCNHLQGVKTGRMS